MNWNEYYDSEIKKIEKTQKHLEKAFIIVLLLLLATNIIYVLGKAGFFI